MNPRRFWIASLSVSALLLLGALVYLPSNWADSASSLLTNPLSSDTTPSLKAKSLILDADLIRVGISDDGMTELEYPSATISATGPFGVLNKTTNQLILQGQGHQSVRVTRNISGFVLETAGSTFGPVVGPLWVKPLQPEAQLKITSVTRKGIIPTYRGSFELVPGYSSLNKFTVVNVLPMQDYLKAVVPNELPFRYGYEAVKAQAVAARNYAIHPREKPWPQFDICDSQYCQAYYGANTEHPQTTRALEETQGLVALYQGEPILALYSSSHGGHSENYENAFSDPKTNRFPGTPIPYLKGGPDIGENRPLSTEEAARAFYKTRNVDSFDVLSPNYRWQKQWGRGELEAVLNKNLAIVSKEGFTKPFVKPAFPAGGRIGALKALRVLERGVSGKIMRLSIEGTHGTWVVEKEFVIRKVLQHGGRFLPSANVVFDPVKDAKGRLVAIKAHGGGFGHGVGMSQLGASYLSKQGRPFTRILQHYYKGVAIGSIPITATETQGMKTQFYVNEPHGMLVIQATPNEPVHVAINGQEIPVQPGQDGHATVDVAAYLAPNALNELRLLPLTGEAPPVKAWVEVYRPG